MATTIKETWTALRPQHRITVNELRANIETVWSQLRPAQRVAIQEQLQEWSEDAQSFPSDLTSFLEDFAATRGEAAGQWLAQKYWEAIQ